MTLRLRQYLFFGVMLAAVGCGVFSSPVYADVQPEPDSSGIYRRLEIVQPNTFRVYATPGETIHVTLIPGTRLEEAVTTANHSLCGEVSIWTYNSTADLTNARFAGTRRDGTTFNQYPKASRVSTCSTSSPNTDLTHRTMTLSYTVPATSVISSIDQAYVINFHGFGDKNSSKDGGKIQGYEWRIAVSTSPTDPMSGRRNGRVWFEGNDTGLAVWQNNPDSALTSNATDHTFVFARKDGYRYALRYNDYQGIWSVFHGGVYGVRQVSTSNPAYMSYGRDTNTRYTYAVTGTNNIAYVFLDCAGGATCPQGIPGLRNDPITSDTEDGVAQKGNPVPKPETSPAATSGLRYTGYTATNLSGGTLTVPYKYMQTGYIRITAKKVSATKVPTVLCQRDFRIDDAEGVGEFTWKVQQDTACTIGTLKTTPAPVIDPASEWLLVEVQARHLGEMHFIDVDTENRGGIEVQGNGLELPGTTSNKWVIWYDPFSRASGHVYGSAIPPQVAPQAVGGIAGDTSEPSGWSSMSSGRMIIPSYSLIGATRADSGFVSNKERAPTSSSVTGGVHGWKSESGCDASGSGSSDGYANDSGTASTESTWGNDRVIEDWTYAYRDPDPRILSLGPNYELIPSVSATVNPVSIGQTTVFQTAVRNQGAINSDTTDWVIRRIVIPVGGTLNTAARNPALATDFSCTYYTKVGGGVTCTDNVKVGTRAFDKNLVTSLENIPETIPEGAQIGSRICYALAVNSATLDPKPNYSEAVSCALIAASPYLVAVGGNVWAGGSTTSPYYGFATVRGAATSPFGSFGEYGVFATDTVDYFGSAGLRGAPKALSGMTNGPLTFANDSGLGRFSTSHKITDYMQAYNCHPTAGSTITLNATVLSAGSFSTRWCADTVVIAGDMAYDTAGANNFVDLPSLTVMANTIVVKAGVNEIAGHYFAKTMFVSCDEGPKTRTENATKSSAITTVGACNKRLVVNGALTIANSESGSEESAVFNRSYGGTKVGEAAEIVRMRPEVFLAPYEQAANPENKLLNTVYETELPPRY